MAGDVGLSDVAGLRFAPVPTRDGPPALPAPVDPAPRTRPGRPAPAVSARTPKGVALWLALLGMATLSFNITRVGGFTVADIFFLGSAVAIWFDLLVGNDRLLAAKRYRNGSQLVLAGSLLLLTFETISAFHSWAPLASMMVTIRMGWTTLVWFWIIRTVARDRAAYMSLIRAYQVSVVISAIAALLGYYGIAFVTTDWGDRQAGLTYHPGELMNFLISGFFFFVLPGIIPDKGAWPQRSTLRWGALVVLMALAIFTTGSTSALVAIAAAALAIGAVAMIAGSSPSRSRRSPIATLLLVALIAVGMFALATSDSPIIERLSGYSDGTSGLDKSVAAREERNSAILNEFDHYLIVGIGPFFAGGGGSSVAESQVGAGGVIHNGVHNMWLKTMYESGFLSLIGLWIIIAASYRQAYRLVLSTKGTALYPVALACVGSLTCAVVSSQFGPTSYARHFWLPFALISGLWAVRRRELDEMRSAASPSPAALRPG